jgi:trans-2,3-dihydro-3-hydroxyanthranilate isomerase
MKEIRNDGLTFYIVDVFALNKYEGNQLAVVECKEEMSDALMQRIAREFNFSETVFLTSIDDYQVRIFTPKTELPFAGHPTLGAAFILNQMYIKENVTTIPIKMKIGEIAILYKYKGNEISEIWMEQKDPKFGNYFSPEGLAEVLGLNEDDIDARFKIQEVSTGVPTIIVPLKDLNAANRIKINEERYEELIQHVQAKTILVFTPQTEKDKANLHVRFFAGHFGVPEDPATGSGNGCLAAYLVKQEYFMKKSIDVVVEQGLEIGRPSFLHLRAEEKGNKYYVAVGGKVILVAKGVLLY